jgi:hypothetical protein
MNKKSKSKIIVDPRGQWAHPGKLTRIPGNDITMQGVPYPVMAYPDFGSPVMMHPEEEYNFPGAKYVDEYPEMKSGRNTDKHVIVKQSTIKGADKGLFSNQSFKKNQLIGLAHRDGQPVGEIGKMHNHSDKPNMYSVKKGNERHVYAKRDIKAGEELTTDYKLQPELEQPDDFKKGGQSPKIRIPTSPKGIKSKAYSRSLEATNRLFALNPLFEVPKSRKRKIFDPNASFYENGGIVSFDYDDTLTSDAGMQMAMNIPNDQKYIVSARGEVTPGMIDRARNAGISEDRIFAMGSDEAKVAKVKELGIDRHIDNKQSVVDQLGTNGQLFKAGGQSSSNDYIEMELSPEEIQVYRDGGYTVEELDDYKKGGALLTKKVTCKKCGWTWDAADGGNDMTTCHKCGGQGLIHAQKGGQSNFYTVSGSEGVYKKVNGKWEVDWNKSGKFQPLSKGDVEKRTAVLNKQAKLLYDSDYNDLANSRDYKAVPKTVIQKAPTVEQKKVQATFNKDFKVTDKSKLEKVQDKIKTDQENLIKWGQENNVPVDQKQLDDVENWGMNVYGKVGNQANPDTIKQVTPEEAQEFWDKAGDIAANPMTAAGFFMRGQDIPDYMQRDMDRGTFGYYANGQLHTERNPLDFALADMTGLSMINDARSAYKGIKDKNVSEAGLGLLGFIPGVSEARKAGKVINAADAVNDTRKAINFSGPMVHSYGDRAEVLGALSQRGKNWDKLGAKGEDLLHKDMVNYHGTYSGRPIVEVKMPDGSSEMFYKSSGWAKKAGAADNGTTEGMWQVYGGHADDSNNWFMKDDNVHVPGLSYKDYYGSNTFRGMAENMDKTLMQKYGLQSTNELDDVLNFQNRYGAVDTYTPKRKTGGFIELDLDEEEIEYYRKGGFTIEEVKFQDGGMPTVPTMQESQTQVVTPMLVPDMMPTGDLVAPPVVTEPIVATTVQQPATLVNTPVIDQPTPTKKEVEKVAMPKIEQSGDVKAIQKKLVTAGYNIGATGPSKDGVDGILGNKTQMALDAFNSGIPPSKVKTIEPKKESQSTKYVINKNLGTGYLPYLDRGEGEEICVKGKGCSFNVSVKMSNLLGEIADGDIWANDAWFNKSDVLNKGGDLIYETTERDISKMPKVPKDVYAKLQVGDYVQLNRINTKTSGEFAAEKQGGLENENVEHLGFVVGKDKDGTPLIWHGSEKGKAFIKRLDEPISLDDHDKSIFTYQVASIVRSPSLKNADLSGLQKTVYYSTIDPKQKLIASKTATERQRQATGVINNNVRNLKNLGYTQEDANFVGQILVGGIMQNETQGGESNKRIPKQIAATLYKDVLGQGEFEGDEASIGYYQMKPTLNFVSKDGSLNALGKKLEKLGVDPKDIGTFDIEAQTKAGAIILLDNYEQLKKDKDFNIKTGLYKGKIPASYILAKSWQAGTDWYKREKYQKYLNNFDIDYSNNVLKNALNTMSNTTTSNQLQKEYNTVKKGITSREQANADIQRAQSLKELVEKNNREAEYQKNNPNYAYSKKVPTESTAVYNSYKDTFKTPEYTTKPIIESTVYKYPERPGVTYKKDSKGKWYVNSGKATGNKYVPIQDPSGSRTKALVKGAVKAKEGGMIVNLTQAEIDRYIKDGYVIEQID